MGQVAIGIYLDSYAPNGGTRRSNPAKSVESYITAGLWVMGAETTAPGG